MIFLLTLACLETFMHSRTETHFFPPLPECLVHAKICPWGCSTVTSSPSFPYLPGTHHSSNVLLVVGVGQMIRNQKANGIGGIGFQHGSTEIKQSCYLLADDILGNKDHTVISKEGAHCKGKKKKKGMPTSKPQPASWSAVAAEETTV